MKYNSQKNYVDASRIKNCINPKEFYENEGQELTNREKNSWKLAGLCPFHADRHVGSFYIHSDNGAFRCFSCDAKGGDVITFTMAKYNLSFYEALKQLANEWGIH